MPVSRERDPGASPLAFFGAELRRWRTAAGLSLEQFGQRVGYSGTLVGKIETGERAPSPEFAGACDRELPGANGLFGRLHRSSPVFTFAPGQWRAFVSGVRSGELTRP